MTWQPIETAPKDGTSILVNEGAAVFDALWDTYLKAWVDGVTTNYDCDLVEYYPTHWQPLPPPPQEPKP